MNIFIFSFLVALTSFFSTCATDFAQKEKKNARLQFSSATLFSLHSCDHATVKHLPSGSTNVNEVGEWGEGIMAEKKGLN